MRGKAVRFISKHHIEYKIRKAVSILCAVAMGSMAFLASSYKVSAANDTVMTGIYQGKAQFCYWREATSADDIKAVLEATDAKGELASMRITGRQFANAKYVPKISSVAYHVNAAMRNIPEKDVTKLSPGEKWGYEKDVAENKKLKDELHVTNVNIKPVRGI